MLIAFEGIDGAGKSTTATLVAQRLAGRGHSVLEVSKRHNGVRGEFPGAQLRALADRLWNVPHDARLATLGTIHWLHLNAAYFAGTHYALSAEIGSGEIAVFDNWINKFVARIVSNGDMDLDGALEIISSVPQPDLIFFLDIPASVAAGRRDNFTEIEQGLMRDGTLHFEAYQTLVGDQLRLMAKRSDWMNVLVGSRNAEEVADHITDRVVSHLEKQGSQPRVIAR